MGNPLSAPTPPEAPSPPSRGATRGRDALEPGPRSVGTVWVNANRTISYDVPFGGSKMSGSGRENGLEGRRAYLATRSVWIELLGGSRDPFRFG